MNKLQGKTCAKAANVKNAPYPPLKANAMKPINPVCRSPRDEPVLSGRTVKMHGYHRTSVCFH